MKSQREQLNEKVKELKVRPLFYRAPKLYGQYSRYATVCLLVQGKKAVARGMAICSPKDSYEEGFGKDCSMGRAIKALLHKQMNGTFDQLLPITRYDLHLNKLFEEFEVDVRKVTDAEKYDVDDTCVAKACFKPALTVFEQKLVESFLKPRPKKKIAA